jgi:MFS family permease
MGGEWASGAVLVGETWPPQHRNKAISIMQSGWAIGYMGAALLAAWLLSDPDLGNEGWRWLFAAGAVPALFVLWIRRNIPESPKWTARARPKQSEAQNPFAVIFGRKLIGRTLRIIALGGAVQFAYWGLFFWLPPFLSRPVEQGGAGMGVVGSLQWIVLMQAGAYLGYLTFGFIADRLGRRRTFVLFMLCAAAIVPVYGQMARNPMVLLVLSPLLGYFGHGYFSMFGSLLAELFPTAVRATGQGTSYNAGRMAGAIAPFTIGAVATLPGIGIGLALGTTSAFFLAASLLVFTLPDKSGQALE